MALVANEAASAKSVSYEDAKRLARFGSLAERQHLAARADAPPEILFFLAADTAEHVRRELAGNSATPGKADLALCQDADAGVRQRLVTKTAERVPGNDQAKPVEIEKLTLEVLSRLAADDAVPVRKALAEALHDRRHAPVTVVRTLARDSETAVAAPVLKHSPTLTDDDLLEIVSAPTSKGALGAIASRGEVSPRVADAIAQSNDVGAITTLLANDSAQIREETLDQLLDQAPQQERWHQPLVHRPKLHAGAVRRLAKFVALSLVEVLAERDDVLGPTAEEVTGVLRERLMKSEMAEPLDAGPARAPEDDRARARRLARTGGLAEDMLDGAIAEGRREFVAAGLAQLAGLDDDTVEHILQSQSARAVVALVWKTGLSMRVAMKIQLQLARIPPQAVISSRGGSNYPMSREEMAWQLQFFGAD